MPDSDNADNLSILSQLDESEKGNIITNEELEEIGAAYGSRKKYEETMRGLACLLSGAQVGRGLVPASLGLGKTGTRIREGTSTVPYGNLPKIKRINIVGKSISSPGDAAALFSLFRDPRIEIFSIAYTSKSGEVLAHTAWTAGLPALTPIFDSQISPFHGAEKIKCLFDKLGADSLWIAHNHPSGDPTPSNEDRRSTLRYVSNLGNVLKGHIILDHDKYSFVLPDGSWTSNDFTVPVKNFVPERREKSTAVSSYEHIAVMFKNKLSGDKDTAACAVLDGRNRVVSWAHADKTDPQGIKNYLRASGGAAIILLTNSAEYFNKFSASAEKALNTKEDIFLDVIQVDKKTGSVERDFVMELQKRGIDKYYVEWQRHEPKTVKYIVDNQAHLNPPLMGRGKNNKEQNMSDLSEPEVSKREFTEAEEAAFRNAIDQRRVISAALKNGTLSCLPGADGYADTGPAVNLENGTRYHGVNLLFLKEHQNQIGAPSAEYVTAEQLEKAKADIPGLALKDGQHGVSIHFSERTEGNEYENKIVKLVNIAQTNKPGELKGWAENRQQERAREQEAYLRDRYGDFYQPREQKKHEGPGPEISCSSTEPEKYLAQYLAAVSMGGKFKASPEQATGFFEKMQASLYEKMPNGYSDPFKLSKITNEASRQCKDIIR